MQYICHSIHNNVCTGCVYFYMPWLRKKTLERETKKKKYWTGDMRHRIMIFIKCLTVNIIVTLATSQITFDCTSKCEMKWMKIYAYVYNVAVKATMKRKEEKMGIKLKLKFKWVVIVRDIWWW